MKAQHPQLLAMMFFRHEEVSGFISFSNVSTWFVIYTTSFWINEIIILRVGRTAAARESTSAHSTVHFKECFNLAPSKSFKFIILSSVFQIILWRSQTTMRWFRFELKEFLRLVLFWVRLKVMTRNKWSALFDAISNSSLII